MVVLVSIARNEAKGIVEWLAHHLALGFDKIVVYDNESTDETGAIVDAVAAAGFPCERIFWPYEADKSPQLSSYADALVRFSSADWVAFFDIDEFLVLKGVELQPWLASFPPDVSGIGVHWLTFGSGGRLTADYELVRDAFRTGPARTAGNNRHIKSFVRPSRVSKIHSHAAIFNEGTYARADGTPLPMSQTIGIAESVDHNVAQFNHYQLKSRQEFEEKIARGRVGKRYNDPARIRENPEVLWGKLDRADAEYRDIDVHAMAFAASYEELRVVLREARII